MSRIVFRFFLLALGSMLGGCEAPCASPIQYSIGQVDPRFRVPPSELRSALRRAEAVWEQAVGRDLFRYADDGPLVVHLVYDDRQKTAQDNARLGEEIDRGASQAAQIRSNLVRVKAQYEQLRREHDVAVDRQKARVLAHNRVVEAWNAQGGGTVAQQEQLRREGSAIRESGEAIEKQRLEVNALAARANNLSERLGDAADAVNANVDAVNASAGREFKQGRYVRDHTGRRIEVFEFVDSIDLVHLLAHEMGHALGLEHNDDPAAVMYGSSSTQMLRPTEADLAPLRTLCGLAVGEAGTRP